MAVFAEGLADVKVGCDCIQARVCPIDFPNPPWGRTHFGCGSRRAADAPHPSDVRRD